MSLEATRLVIANLINDNWSATDTVIWEGLENDYPEQDEWIMVHIIFNSSSAFSFTEKRRSGILQVDVFTRRGTGTKCERELTDSLSTLLEGVQTSGVHIRDMSMDFAENVDAWRKSVVSFEFDWLEE